MNPQQPLIFLASTSWSHCFDILKKKKEMVAVDQYIIATFFASLAGFLLLFLLRRNDKKTTKKDAGTYKIRNDIVHSSVGDGDYSSPDGTDVIIVGAGVAGAALAHTFGKVISFTLLLLYLFIFYFPLFQILNLPSSIRYMEVSSFYCF